MRNEEPRLIIGLLVPLRHSPSAIRLPNERHCREPPYAGAAQQLQQERFDLIVLVLGEDDVIGPLPCKRCVTGRARRGLDAPAAGNLDPGTCIRNVSRPALAPAKRFPQRGIRMQLVIDMQRAQPDPQPRGNAPQAIEQHDGINTAAQSHHKLIARRNDRSNLGQHTGSQVGAMRFTFARLP